jgi:RimJ/RimL family protein N-acetyltransferase
MIELDEVVLRALEPKDVNSLYSFRNDCEVIRTLGGFSAGYSRSNLEDWIKRHSNRADEVLWTIADRLTDKCVGHSGLYQIDTRVRKAEFAILIGERKRWGQGLGKKVTNAVIRWGFSQLNLHKITLSVLTNNSRAIHLYEALGFRCEGVLHDEQFRDGRYLDLMLMAIFETEWRAAQGNKDEP